MEEFTWCPSIEADVSVSQSVFSVQFGDGYKQAVGNGINNKSQSWGLTFRGRSEEIEMIAAFIDRHGGYLPFLWTPKDSTQLVWDCAGYNKTINTKDVSTLTCVFNQRFLP